MDEPRRFPTLSCVLAAAAIISISSAFNINVRNSDVVSGEQKDFFGYKVLQFSSSRNKGIIVTAPLNGSGAIFRRDQNRTEKWFRPDDRSPSNSSSVKHLGLSVAAHPTGSRFTVCSPSLFHECNGNSYLNSLCYNLTDELQQISSFKPVFQECIKETVNLVFLFDGSQSMTTGEFNKNKDFIKDMMETLKNTSIKFAAVQFSLVTRTVFDFNDYDAGRALEKLSKEKHMKSLTNTYQALRFVWSEILENPASGASPDATKALVVITDGDPSDSDTNNIVKQYDGKDIIRIVIGVKDVDINHFKPIASEPKDTNVFKIDNYNGLEGVLKNFQNKIFKIEGSKVTRAEEMTNEMSQAGFSSVFHKETLVLGSVGSNSWRGSLHEHQEQNETQISDPEMEMDSYMGYSLSVGERKGVPLYFAGAPRFNHTGQVVLFTQNNKNWTTAQRINADQIGSYFGAELCSVDIDSDGNTDFLLVGAPMFYQPQEKREGRIYIYRLSDEIQLMSVYHVTAPSKGRFGSTISSLSDLNGDELRDVAVGAPLEDDNRGAVYIYLGDRDKGIRSPFSQLQSSPSLQLSISTIIVTAPLNGSGAIFRRDQNRTEKWFRPDDRSPSNSSSVKHLGLSVAAHPTGSRFTVCSPSLFHECNGNSYLNSLCYNLTDELQQISSFKPVFQECIKETVNLVFLFDGSQSMTTGEFNKNKDFIKDMMETLKNTSIKFAAVQFSLVTRTVFDFNDYDAGRALEKLSKEKHMKSLTNTYQALRFVWSEILENPASGASPDATKALVVITDGDPSDSDTNNIVKQYDGKDIIRIVIGVKDVDINHFKPIASEPKDTNVFKIDNYNGLEGVLKNFQNKIFKIEGSKVTRAEEMTNEMSQAGFSSVFHKETLVLGSVGSNSWRGSLHEHQEQNETQISDPEMEMDSYMGYSLSVGERKGVPLYFAGAPRFNHTGQVVLFTQNNKNWTTAQRINADQIGSYFGAELCSVDIDSDGNTDFLLVGAPMFYQPQEKREGRIYIYRLSDEIQLMSVYHVTAPSKGRFGSTISSLSDLNGDELRDVAVGAPLEDDNRGAVYIYLGDRDKGIRSPFSQRITGKKLGTGIRFFGQAIDGHLDLGDDGLPDIVVGSQGAAVVLRSKPIFNVTAHLSFYPGEISTEDIDCLAGKDKSLPMGTITACFEKEEATKSKGEAARSGLNISYTLNVDPMRQTNRGFFPQNEKKDRSITHFSELLETKTCFNHSINMPKCVRDTLSPVDIRLNFSQVDSETVGVVLNVDSGRQAVVEAPFEKHCRTNDICIAQLTVDFNFTSETLLVTENNYFNVSIKLDNDGDDSYNTTLTMHYPPGLSFSRMNLTQSSRSTLHSCFDLDGVFDKTVCGISLPVYRSKASATFKTAFHVSKYFEWNDTLSMTVTGTSDNSNSSSSFSVTKSIPVQYQIRMALTVNENTVSYLNFTPEDTHPKNMDIIYKIDNIGFKEFPVDVSLFFPTKLEHNFEVIDYQVFVQQNKTQCSNSSDLEGPEFCSPENKCVVVKCDSFILKNNSGVEFRLKGNVQFKDFKQHAANVAFLKRYTGVDKEVKFKSFIKVDYDRKTYVLASHKQEKKGSKQEQLQKSDLWKEDSPTMKWAEVRVEFINPPDQLQIILTGAGLGLLLLIIITIIMIKLGCFRRKRPDYYQEQEEQVSIQDNKFAEMTPGPSNETTISETFEKPDEIQEKKKLLDASEANGSPVQADEEKDPDQLENINVS